MSKIFLLGCLLAVVFSFMGCSAVQVNAPSIPAHSSWATPKPVTATATTSVAELKADIYSLQKQLNEKKAELKQAQTVKLEHEMYIAAGIFSGLALLCVALAWFIPDPTPTQKMKRIALRGLLFCVVGVALSFLAARLVPYRTWIEIGIATITSGWVLFEVYRHQHITLKNLMPKI